MSLLQNTRVFGISLRLGAKRIARDPLTLAGQFLTYALIMIIYSAFFKAMDPATLAAKNMTPAVMTWYLGGTEWPLFCFTGYLAKSFQFDLQAGAYESALLRPTSGWIVTVGNWLGGGLVSAAILFAPCFLCTYWLAGSWELGGLQIIGLCVSLCFAGVLFTTAAFMIGASCLWLQQSEPLIWIFYKCAFLFGALTWPLVFFPPLMAKLVWLSPFPGLLHVLGAWTQTPSLDQGLFYLSYQLFWICLFTLATSRMNKAILRRYQREAA